MRLQFLQSVHLKKAPGHSAKDYKLGVHEVPSAVLKANHATIEKFIKAGWIIEGEAVKAVSLETPKERSLRLAEKLGIDVSKEKAALAKPAEEAPFEPSEEESEEMESSDDSESEDSEEASSEDEPEVSKKSKRKRK